MKNVLKGLLIAVLVIVTAGFCANFFLGRRGGSIAPTEYTYRVKYLTLDGADLKTELPFMFLADGNYPDTFKNVDADFWIDDLKRKETKDPSNYQKTYSFRGWYTDADCTQPFDGLVTSGTGHDVVIYAKIAVGWWTPWNPL